jgi:hypothetical protein
MESDEFLKGMFDTADLTFGVSVVTWKNGAQDVQHS